MPDKKISKHLRQELLILGLDEDKIATLVQIAKDHLTNKPDWLGARTATECAYSSGVSAGRLLERRGILAYLREAHAVADNETPTYAAFRMMLDASQRAVADQIERGDHV